MNIKNDSAKVVKYSFLSNDAQCEFVSKEIFHQQLFYCVSYGFLLCQNKQIRHLLVIIWSYSLHDIKKSAIFFLPLHFFTNKINAYEKKQIIKQLRLFNRIIIVCFQHFVSKKGYRHITQQSNDTHCFTAKN